jgi:N-acetylneuraminate synthase
MANKLIQIGETSIGDNQAVFFIAEIGLNHNGSVELAKKLIDASFACNWHCVKFQKRTPDICVPDHQKNVIRETPWGKITYLEYRYKVEFEKKEYSYIHQYCQEKPIFWTASAWDLPSLHFLIDFNVPFIKIPSAKLTEDELLIIAAKSGKPVFLSTGMSTIEEVDHAVNLLEKHTKGNYVLMHTNSTYPTPLEEVNLSLISLLKDRYDCIVGYSGHEFDLQPSVVAAALGAKVIERHITLDHKMWGSDHFASLEIEGMIKLKRRVNDVKNIMGDGIKKVTDGESKIRKKLRG